MRFTSALPNSDTRHTNSRVALAPGLRSQQSAGEVLREDFLVPYGLSQHALAMRIHVPATRIGDIVHGRRAITPDTALRLARFFGTSPQLWMNLQQAHDLSKASIDSAAAIEREVEVLT
jgi:addiction module HigA family antidote